MKAPISLMLLAIVSISCPLWGQRKYVQIFEQDYNPDPKIVLDSIVLFNRNSEAEVWNRRGVQKYEYDADFRLIRVDGSINN